MGDNGRSPGVMDVPTILMKCEGKHTKTNRVSAGTCQGCPRDLGRGLGLEPKVMPNLTTPIPKRLSWSAQRVTFIPQLHRMQETNMSRLDTWQSG